MKKYILFIMGMFCASTSLYAQSPPGIKPLSIGDTVPDITLNHILNYKDTTAKLSDFRGKLVILDFWATWCGSCIATFPRLDSLQSAFKDKLKVLAITSQDKKVVTGFMAMNSIAHNVSLTFVTGDSLLVGLFPHQLIPHEVWISSQGTVMEITGSGEVTATNIQMILDNLSPTMEQKRDLPIREPLFSSTNLPQNKLVHYSILLKGNIPGLFGTYRNETNEAVSLIGITDRPLLDLYKMAARHQIPHFSNRRIIFELADRHKLDYSDDDFNNYDWVKKNLYSYEIIVPLKDADRIYDYMLEDLNRYSGYSGRIEKCRVPCLVLARIKKSSNISSDPSIRYAKNGNSVGDQSKTYSIPSLLSWFNMLKCIKVPVVDETGYRGEITIDFSRKPGDMEALQKELSSYNLNLIPSERMIDMLVLSDKISGHTATTH